MRIESIKCLNYQTTGDTLILTLAETDLQEIESVLIGKPKLTSYTDNLDFLDPVETFYDYGKADSCKFNYDDNTYTLTLRKLSTVEKKVQELERQVALLTKTDPNTTT